MPLYFAFGSNMDEAALRTRAPNARALGLAHLPRHRFLLMQNGFASVARDPAADVHGVLFDLAPSDIPPLDDYEGVDEGLYGKATETVIQENGTLAEALVYIGNERNDDGYSASPGYMERIVTTAKGLRLPAAYVAMLESMARSSGMNP